MRTPVPPAFRRAEIVALGALLAGLAMLLAWWLPTASFGNQYYAAIAQSGARSWTAFLFTGVDPAGGTAADKPPVGFWPMALSVRLFGLRPWAVLLPQVLLALVTVLLTHLSVRRVAGRAAGLVAAAVTGTTPVFVVMGAYDHPDLLLTTFTVLAAHATLRALAAPEQRRWLVLLGLALGLAFTTKWLAAFVPAPAFVGAIAWQRRRAGGADAVWRAAVPTAIAGAIASLWFVLLLVLVPASARPVPDAKGGVLDLILGQNGVSRFNTSGYSAPASELNGSPGPLRFVLAPFAGDIGWLTPLTLVALVWLALAARRARRMDLPLVVFGGWFVLTWLAFSFMGGAMHPYYTVVCAPAIGGVLGLATARLLRGGAGVRRVAALALALSGAYAVSLLAAQPSLRPWAWVAGVLALLAAATLAVPRAPIRVAVAVAAASVLVGPTVWAAATWTSPVSGANPIAGPVQNDHGRGPWDPRLVQWLQQAGAGHRWAVAVPTATPATSLQLQAERPVLVLGGFTGQANFPAEADLERWGASGELRWIVLAGPYTGATATPEHLRGSQLGAAMDWAMGHACRMTVPGTTVEVLDLGRPTPGPCG